MPTIVLVNVSLTLAPLPETLQETGALISVGGTNTSPGTTTVLTQPSDLTPILNTAKAISGIIWAGNVATVTTSAAHGLIVGDTVIVTIGGAVPAGYNGTFLSTVTGASTFTYPLGVNPGAETTPGTWIPGSVAELTAMVTTFFAQGAGIGVFVLELGPVGANNGIAALNEYLIENPNSQYTSGAQGFFYSYLTPRSWDANANLIALVANYQSTTSKTYFWITTTLSTYTTYSVLDKDVVLLVEAPAYGVWPANVLTAISYTSGVVSATTTTAHGVNVGQWFQISGCTPIGYNGWWQAQAGTTGSTLIYNSPNAIGAESALGTLVQSKYTSAGVPSTEFTLAADFQHTLNYDPSPTNQVAPNAFAFLFGVTPFPTRGNNALLETLKTANVNYVGTGAEGGIPNAIMLWGVTQNSFDFQIWYSVDWVQINVDLDLSNEIINGSNNPLAPLYYDQNGVNRLQARAAQTVADGVAFGLVLGAPVQTQLDGPGLLAAIAAGTYAGLTIVNAIPFISYVTTNTGDYQIGKYAGMSIIYTPKRGFIQIIFNVNVNFFPGQV